MRTIPAAGGGGGAVTFVGATTSAEDNDGTHVVTRAGVTSGNLLAVPVQWEDLAGPVSVSDDKGNTYTAVGADVNNGGNTYCNIFYAKNVTGGTVQVTVNFGGGLFHDAAILEFAGASITAPLDDTDVGTGSGTAVATANITTSAASCGLVCVVARYNAGTVAPGSGYTQDYDADAFFVAHKISGAAGTYVGDGTIDSGGAQIWAAAVAAFKP